MNDTTAQPQVAAPALTSHADQLAAHLRDARCCDPFAPCRPCVVKRLTVQVERRLAAVPSIPTQRTKESR